MISRHAKRLLKLRVDEIEVKARISNDTDGQGQVDDCCAWRFRRCPYYACRRSSSAAFTALLPRRTFCPFRISCELFFGHCVLEACVRRFFFSCGFWFAWVLFWGGWFVCVWLTCCSFSLVCSGLLCFRMFWLRARARARVCCFIRSGWVRLSVSISSFFLFPCW